MDVEPEQDRGAGSGATAPPGTFRRLWSLLRRVYFRAYDKGLVRRGALVLLCFLVYLPFVAFWDDRLWLPEEHAAWMRRSTLLVAGAAFLGVVMRGTKPKRKRSLTYGALFGAVGIVGLLGYLFLSSEHLVELHSIPGDPKEAGSVEVSENSEFPSGRVLRLTPTPEFLQRRIELEVASSALGSPISDREIIRKDPSWHNDRLQELHSEAVLRLHAVFFGVYLWILIALSFSVAHLKDASGDDWFAALLPVLDPDEFQPERKVAWAPEDPGVFVSYPRSDRSRGRRAVGAMRKNDWRVEWCPKARGEREVLTEMIEAGVGECRCAVVLLRVGRELDSWQLAEIELLVQRKRAGELDVLLSVFLASARATLSYQAHEGALPGKLRGHPYMSLQEEPDTQGVLPVLAKLEELLPGAREVRADYELQPARPGGEKGGRRGGSMDSEPSTAGPGDRAEPPVQ